MQASLWETTGRHAGSTGEASDATARSLCGSRHQRSSRPSPAATTPLRLASSARKASESAARSGGVAGSRGRVREMQR